MSRGTTPDDIFRNLEVEDLITTPDDTIEREELRIRKRLKRIRYRLAKAYPSGKYHGQGDDPAYFRYFGLTPCSLSRAECLPEDNMHPYVDGNPCKRCQGINIDALLSAEGYLLGSYQDLLDTAKAGCGICNFILEEWYLPKRRHDPLRKLGEYVHYRMRKLHKSALFSIKFGNIVNVPYCGDEVHIYVDGHFTGSIGLCTDAGDSVSKMIPGRRPVLRPNVQYVTQLIKSWNYSCLDQVDKYINRPRNLPKRVINVSSPKLYLEDYSDLPDEQRPTGLYVTLSHRWDETRNPLKATTINLPELMSSISIDRLPLGFRDAINLTRRLGILYIWIDSLCIIQDSPLDWEEESSKMGSYYSSSWLNIAIGLESHFGCFPNRDVSNKRYIMCRTKGGNSSALYFCELESFESIDNEHASILYERAWTFQEEMLSPRSVTFTKNRIFYHCDSCIVSERGIQTMFSNYPHVKEAPLTKEDIYEGRWENMVESYFKRRLTKYEDRLPALSGIAHIYQLTWNDDYLAGIWKKYLPWQLCWYIGGIDSQEVRKSPPGYRAPSWSWAAIEGRLGKFLSFVYNAYTRALSPLMVELVDVKIELVSADPMGSVKGGKLALYGFMRKAKLDADFLIHDLEHSFESNRIRGTEEDGTRISCIADPIDSVLRNGQEICLLNITRWAALVLIQVPTSDHRWAENTYERIGFTLDADLDQIEGLEKHIVNII
ncbi:hypothetical protein NHQ30_003263 [Ciborinia camelliae]|nr:hypothetical protein NHQ30_003263 [Ciborinia camelliae]